VPAWNEVDVNFATRVGPFERRKLRLLNGAHTFLAYEGQLRGYGSVREAMGDSRVRNQVEALWRESGETLSTDDTAAYCARLLERFTSPSLHHALAQIAMDGSQKIPVRILAPMLERLDQRKDSPALATAVAAWLEFLWAAARDGSFSVDDPGARGIVELMRHAPDREAMVAGLFETPTFEAFSPLSTAITNAWNERVSRNS
ncbi:MAG: mannitol dehydrogenase family protein, partial [Myxococcota bacterium]